MSRNLSFRPVETEDRAFLLSLFTSARERELENVNWDGLQRETFLEMQYNAQQAHYQNHFPQREHRIILLDNRSIGMMDISRGSGEIRVLDIILRPENRNYGIGTSLMSNLLEESDRSAQPVRLYVEKFNPVLSLYKRLGFQTIDDTGVHYHMERLPDQTTDPLNPSLTGEKNERS